MVQGQGMLEILSITGPIYLIIALGYGATRWGGFATADMRVLGKFVIQLALPAMLFSALAQRSVREVFNLQYLAAYALACGAVLVLGFVWTRRVTRQSMSFSSMVAMGMGCPNSGFVGYPVLFLVLGGSVASVSLALNVLVENLLLVPVLLVLSDLGDHRKGAWHLVLWQSLKGLLRNPMVLSMAAGVAASLAGVTLPAPLSRTVQLFAQASGALSLFVIGGSLVGLHIKGTLGTVAKISAGKLLLHPLAMLLVLGWVVPVDDPQLRAAALLSCAMPMLGIYAILSQRHGHEGTASAALLVTTVASFVTLSAFLWWWGLAPL
jgi:malonate transporter and related proteins